MVEVAKGRNAEALEDVVDLKECCQDLSKVAEDVIPTNGRRSERELNGLNMSQVHTALV